MTFLQCARRRLTDGLLATLVLATGLSGLTRMAAAEPKTYSSYDSQVRPLVERMSLEEKIGQMTQPELGHLGDFTDISKYFIGSVLSGGGSDPKAGNSLEAWTDVYDRCQEQALKTRLGIPILYGIDAVHGHSNVLAAVIFPHNVGLGCTRDPQLVEEVARITAIEVRATGIQWTFSPCVTVPRDDRWGRTYEGFSEDTHVAASLGKASVLGYQGDRMSNPLAIVACAKHYLGDGGTSPNTGDFLETQSAAEVQGVADHPSQISFDQGDTRIDEEELRRIHLPPYVEAVEAGVATIMPSYNSWNGEKCTGSKYLLTDVLKNELGFEGFLISDYNAIDQVDPDYKTAVEKSINAGVDMGMVPNTYKKFYKSLKELVEEGRVPMSRIDDAVTRILRVKAAAGLLDEGRSQLADRSLHESFGSAEHRAVAREAVRKSLVLLKNDDQTLPLSKNAARIHVGGKSADDVGDQCGGWTIEWQGRSGDVTPGGTTILDAVNKAVGDGTTVTYAQDGNGAEGADVGIVVVGEKPYAEGVGDDGDLTLDAEDVAAIDNMKAAGIPVVVVILSGRPMVLGDVLGKADAIVAAWLPGTEGDGVADVLFGDYAPTGKLSFTWPRSNDQAPINVGDADYDPLFPFGYGLTYDE
jgi:beta-glucosidase